jgi:TP901 family phage tail tape measure protein
MAEPIVNLTLDGDVSRITKKLRELERSTQLNIKVNDRAVLQPLGRIRTGVDQINSSLDAANQRVLTFAASALLLGGVSRAFGEILNSTRKVEKALLDINSVFGLSTTQLNKFSKEIFNIARETAQSFDTVSKAAIEFSRQGLGVEETQKRLRASLILTRLSGLDSAKAVESMTAAINGFSRENLKASEILNKLVAVDTKFAVSTADLSEALSRVGSTAQDAGVSFDKLLGLVASAQQTTARGGAVIGNAFKTIFTRIQRPEVLTQLESFGVQVKDFGGEVLAADKILENLAKQFDNLSRSQQQSVVELSAGIYQVNQFRAILGDLGKTYNLVEQATRAASSASNEAEKRNAALNKSLDSTLQTFKTALSEAGAIIGDFTLAPFIKDTLGSDFLNAILNSIKGANTQDSLQKPGEQIAEGFLRGISNVITGPALVAAFAVVSAVVRRTARVVQEDLGGLVFRRNKEADAIKGLSVLLNTASQKDKERLQTATSIAQKEQIILEILAKQNALRNQQVAQQNNLATGISRGSPGAYSKITALGRSGFTPNFAGNPLKDAIAREIKAGVNPKDIYIDSDPRVKGPKNPLGLLVANKRDEPLGGYQGVQRAISEGVNPRNYGTQVPNFAEFDKFEGTISKGAMVPVPIQINELEAKELRSLFGQLRTSGTASVESFKEITERIKSAADRFNLTDKSLQLLNAKIDSAATKLALNLAKPTIFYGGTRSSSGIASTQSGGKLSEQFGGIISGSSLGNRFKLSDPTEIEESLKKTLDNLSNKQISGITGRNVNRAENIFSARTIFDEPVLNRGAANKERIGGLLNLASSGTLQTDFESTVKKLVVKGTSLSSAYEQASNNLLKSGGTAKQLTAAQLEYAYRLTDFSGEVESQRRAIKGTIATRNLTNAIDNKGVAGLNNSERRQLAGGIKSSVTQDLFGNIDPEVLKADKEAQRVIARETGKRFSQLRKDALEQAADQTADDFVTSRQVPTGRFSSYKGLFRNFDKEAEQFIGSTPNLSKQSAQKVRERALGLNEQRKQNLNSAALQAAFLVPLAAGFAPQGEGGTSKGKLGGAISGAAAGFGTGALLGSILPGPGTLIGGAVGAAAGGTFGFISKLSQSFEELSQTVNNINASYTQQIDAVGTYIQLQQKINDAVERGTSEKELKGLVGDQFSVLQRIKDPSIRAQILSAGTDVGKISEAGRGLSERGIRVGATGDVRTALKAFSDDNTSKNIIDAATSLAVATDRSNKQINEAFTSFRNTFESNPLGAFKEFADELGLSQKEIDDNVKLLRKSPEDVKFLFRLFVKNSDQFVEDLKVSTQNLKRVTQAVDFASITRDLSRAIGNRAKISESNLGSQLNISRTLTESGILAQNLNPEREIQTRADFSIQENRLRNQGQTESLIQGLRSELVSLRGKETDGITLGANGDKILSSLSSVGDLTALLRDANVTTQELIKNVIDQIVIGNNIAENTEKEIAAQRTADILRVRLETKNRALQGGVFNQDSLSSFGQSRRAGNLIGGGVQNINNRLGGIEALDAFGLPESDQTDLIRNAIRFQSGKKTYAKILGELLEAEVGESEAELQKAVNDIVSSPNFGLLDKETAKRVGLGLTAAKDTPEQSLAKFAAGDFGGLISSGKISTDTGALGISLDKIGTKLDPLTLIKDNTGDMAGLMAQFLNATKERRKGVEQGDRLAETRAKIGANESRLTQAEDNFISKAKTPDILSGLITSSANKNIVSTPAGNIPTPTRNILNLVSELKKRSKDDENLAETLNLLKGENQDRPFEDVNLTLKEIRELILDQVVIDEKQVRFLNSLKDRIKLAERELTFVKTGETPLGAAFKGVDMFKYGITGQPAAKTDPSFRFFENKGVDIAKESAEQTNTEKEAVAKIYNLRQLTAVEIKEIVSEGEKGINIEKLQEKGLLAQLEILTDQKAIYNDLNKNSLTRLQYDEQILQKELEIAQLTGDSADTFTKTIELKFNQLKQEMNDFSGVAAGIFDSFQNNAGQAFGDFVTGAKSGKDAFRDFVTSVLNDAARAFASKAVQGIIGSAFGAFGTGFAAGGPVKLANGGTVPALLMGGEYYVSPQSAKSIGKDTLDRLNNGSVPKFASGGQVGSRNFYISGGSGTKDDIPARLSPGGYVLKKSAVSKYGRDYIEKLANNKVEKKLIGGVIGALVGAAVGGGIGYATGGKKGALVGAGIGAIGGAYVGSQMSAGPGITGTGVSANNLPSSSSFSNSFNNTPINTVGGGVADFSSSVTNGVGASTAGAVGKIGFKGIAFALGASALLGVGVQALSPKDKGVSYKDTSPKVKKKEEMSEGEFAYLQENPQGGISLIGYGQAPATRRFSEGGPVPFGSSLSKAFPVEEVRVNNEVTESSRFNPYEGLSIGYSKPIKGQMPKTQNFDEGGPVNLININQETVEQEVAPKAYPSNPTAYSKAMKNRYVGETLSYSSPIPSAPGWADGGYVGSAPMSNTQSEPNSQTMGAPTVYINITNNNGEVKTDTNTEGGQGNGEGPFGKDFANKIEKQVRGIVRDEMVQSRRTGNMSKRNS